MESILETDRLELRRFTDSDVDNLVWLDSDPAVMRFLTGEPTERSEIEHNVLPKVLHDYQLSALGRFAVIERSSVGFVGWVALQPPVSGDLSEVELGYRFASSAWGRGYATECSRALINKGFAECGIQRVWAQTMAVNVASRRVLEKVGLTYVRTFYQHFDDALPGTDEGEVEYELRRSSWTES